MDKQKTQAVATTVLVRKQFITKGVEGEVAESDHQLEVHVFQTEPAKVSFEAGVTMNMGNYESARISVGVSVPCYKEELPDALVFARAFVEGEIAKQMKEVKSSPNKKKDLF